MAEDAVLDGQNIVGLSADDIIPTVYEGGFKTWECSVDLAGFLASNKRYLGEEDKEDATVIEVFRPTSVFDNRLLVGKHKGISS